MSVQNALQLCVVYCKLVIGLKFLIIFAHPRTEVYRPKSVSWYDKLANKIRFSYEVGAKDNRAVAASFNRSGVIGVILFGLTVPCWGPVRFN
jgi:hypothetical protein